MRKFFEYKKHFLIKTTGQVGEYLGGYREFGAPEAGNRYYVKWNTALYQNYVMLVAVEKIDNATFFYNFLS